MFTPTFRALATFSMLGLLAAAVNAATVVTPNPTPTQQSQGPAPLNYDGTSGSRVQQVQSASFFNGLGGPILINSIAFRPTNIDFGTRSVSVSNINIQLSATSKLDEAGTPLSATFANNAGLLPQTVYSGPLTLTTAFTGAGPKDFDYIINLQTPYLYDPGLGNLLLDVTIPDGASVTSGLFGFIKFDTANDLNDGVYSIVNLSAGSAATGTESTAAAITQFGYTSATSVVPEPASLALLLGPALLFLGRRRRVAA